MDIDHASLMPNCKLNNKPFNKLVSACLSMYDNRHLTEYSWQFIYESSQIWS